MKIKIIKSKFIEALKSVQNIVVGKGSLQILQNVCLEGSGDQLTLMTTDLDITIKSVVKCEILEEGGTTLPVKLLFNLISKVAEGEVELTSDREDRATIVAGTAKYKLSGMSIKEFPALPSDEDVCLYEIYEQTFREMLKKVSYAASQDDTRRTLKGVLLSFKDNKLTMVATDGRRLAMIENEVEFPKSAERDIILPSKTVGELLRSLNGDGSIKLQINKSQICFNFGSLQVFSKLIDETYPNYLQVIPKNTAETIEVDRQALLDALDRASVMTIDEVHSTKLVFESGKLTVMSAATNIGEAKDEVPIKYAGEKVEIMFNPSYVMDPLKVIDDDVIKIKLNDGHSPAVINCSIPFVYVLMPLRIS